ncbi:MAG: glycoside hydrolase family 5 protein, partial [Lachnospiraceae bacterium]|nr:glycoside hydrolase family 5 protein [Lachnospiraceae bacterium]
MKGKIVLALCGVVILLGLIGVGFMFAARTRAVRFVKNMGQGLNLGNTLDATGLREYEPDADDLEYETSWGNPRIDAETFKAIKEAGFKTVRIPVTWEDHLDAEYRIAEPWLHRIQEVVDMAMGEDLYVILDLHHDAWLDLHLERESEIRDELLTVWGQIAERFQNYDEKLLFEAMNE